MSDTPRTDAARISAWGEGGISYSIGFSAIPVEFSRQLERELAETRGQLHLCNVDQFTTAAELDKQAKALEAALAEPTVKESLIAQRPWVALTDEELKQCSYDADGVMINREEAMRNVEAKIKEKNGG